MITHSSTSMAAVSPSVVAVDRRATVHPVAVARRATVSFWRARLRPGRDQAKGLPC